MANPSGRKTPQPTVDAAKENDWQAEDDHRTMMRAADIQADPKRMMGVRKHQKKTLRSLVRVGRSLGRGGSRA